MMKTLLGIKTWFNPALIPNRPDFKFIAEVDIFGKPIFETICVTEKLEFSIRMGIKVEGSNEQIEFDDILRWREV